MHSNMFINLPVADLQKSIEFFTKVGYTFTKWNTQADGLGVDHGDGSTYSFASDLTLYAIWSNSGTPAPTTVTFPDLLIWSFRCLDPILLI